jgi:hypothetical protein
MPQSKHSQIQRRTVFRSHPERAVLRILYHIINRSYCISSDALCSCTAALIRCSLHCVATASSSTPHAAARTPTANPTYRDQREVRESGATVAQAARAHRGLLMRYRRAAQAGSPPQRDRAEGMAEGRRSARASGSRACQSGASLPHPHVLTAFASRARAMRTPSVHTVFKAGEVRKKNQCTK